MSLCSALITVSLPSPGLMITSAAIYHVLHFFHITIDIRNVCVFLAPLFSSFTTIVTYHLTKELKVWGPSGCAPQALAVQRRGSCLPFVSELWR